MASAAGPILGVLGGCMGCMVVVENIAKQDPSAMNLITFSTFLFIAVHGLFFTYKFGANPIRIPLSGYIRTATIFVIVNVVNNQALNFHVPVPLHIIFRSGSLLANLLLDVFYVGKRYNMRKYLSVAAITAGIILCTLAGSSQEKDSGMSLEEASKHYKEWTIGIAMLTFALLASALMAIWQTDMYKKYGKHPEEAMFVIHLITLPLFLLMWEDISNAASRFTESAPYSLPILGEVPSLWANLVLNCFLQYFCIHFVYSLNASQDALTVTLVVTLRKFLSLLVSIVWFKNPFTTQHWIGAILVFAGTLAFADIWGTKEVEKKKKQ